MNKLERQEKKRAKLEAKQAKALEKEEKKRKRAKNKPYAIVSYMFVAMFVSLIGYLVYFNVIKSEEFINSPYNTRQDTFADRVIRGDIRSSDGEILATTEVYEDGTENRYYPFGNMFAHVIGYDTKGKSGLESEANFQLLTSHAFFLEQLKNEFQNQKNRGDTVVTTLNANLQVTAYNALGDRRGAVVALEPSTGKIIAMVSKPDFNPNTIDADWEYLVNDSENTSLLNRSTQGQYPPGSIFKVVTALDYLREHGTISGFSYDCMGSITSEDHTITCYGGAVHGVEDLSTAFAHSCNCAFAQMGMDLGGASLRNTGESLLFNKKLPLSMEYHKSLMSIDGSAGNPLMMQTAIGQGNTLVSPMHMAMITSAIANDGVLMTPYLIDHVENYSGNLVSEKSASEYKRLMSTEEAQTLEQLMCNVVTTGTATALSGLGYSVAGKTGSAEFDEYGNSHSWFIGYSNVENPELVVAIIVENGGTGSEAAVPVAQQLFETYHYNH